MGSDVLGRAAACATRCAKLGAQLAALAALDGAGHLLASRLTLPVPGNLLGMLLLLALLSAGVVKVSWLDDGATLLTRHLAFFFIPIAVGLLGYGPVFAAHPLAILVTLVASAAVGLAACAIGTERLAARKGGPSP